jgi:polygalacturonase
MTVRFSLLFLALTALASAASYNVRDFGATGDGTTKDTRAFQKALDTCAVNGGGDVVVPAGKYLIGSIQLGQRTILRLDNDSVLMGTPDLADYPLVDIRWEGRWQPGHRGLIYANAVDHIGIVGPGRIEGSLGPIPSEAASAPTATATPTSGAAPGRGGFPGRRGWGTNGPDGTRNPVVLEPISCNDVRWDGFTVTQGGNWATHPTYCNDVVITNLNISGGRDGIDVDSCRNVRIDHCTINNGDDCISLKSGRGMDGARLGRACEDILITNCTMTGRTFACVGIGSETSGGVRNVRIEHCRLTARTHAIYIKTRIGRAGANDAITGDDLEINGGDFLRINLVKGGNNSTADDPVEGLVGYPSARDLRFSNIRMMPGSKAIVVGTEVSALKPVHGLTLTNVTGTCSAGLTLANMTEVVLQDIKVTGVSGPLLGVVNVTGTGLDGAVAIPAPVDPPAGNAPGFGPGRGATPPPAPSTK